MSHYAVLVIKDQDTNLEEMLEPYSENLAVEPHIDRTKQEMIEEAKAYKEKLLERIKENPWIPRTLYKGIWLAEL